MSQTNSKAARLGHQSSSWPEPASSYIDPTSVSDGDIAVRAYEKYVARGRVDGFDREDWAAAKRELILELFGTSSKAPHNVA